MEKSLLTTDEGGEYRLLDSGREEKLERFGTRILARPDPQALWEKRLPESEWKKADAWYERRGREGKWHVKKDLPQKWPIAFGGLTFLVRPTSFKHVGLFPEQRSNWEWTTELVRGAGRPLSILNLFAYTGGATMAAAKAGAAVTHVDASKTANAWARENAAVSGLSDKPIRWITEDVMVYLRREKKRGVRYDGITMDPPAFGHGPKDELWKIEQDFLKLMTLCRELLSERPLFMLLSGYAAGYSSLMFVNNLSPFQERFGGAVEHGELAIRESGAERMLPCGIFARWSTPS
ncbi:MAG: class I SAM-dependent methyltransferase [Patescibacteria group bacterium]